MLCTCSHSKFHNTTLVSSEAVANLTIVIICIFGIETIQKLHNVIKFHYFIIVILE